MPRPAGSVNIITRKARTQMAEMLEATQEDALNAMKKLLAEDYVEGLKCWIAMARIIAPHGSATCYTEKVELEEENRQLRAEAEAAGEELPPVITVSNKDAAKPDSMVMPREDLDAVAARTRTMTVDELVCLEAYHRATYKEFEWKHCGKYERRVRHIHAELREGIERRILQYRAWPGNKDPDWLTKDYSFQKNIAGDWHPICWKDYKNYPSQDMLYTPLELEVKPEDVPIQDERWMIMKKIGLSP